MKLYHGTSSKHFKSIMKNGLQPRREKDSNWGDENPSQKYYVYLSQLFPCYFAHHTHAKDNSKMIIVEIDSNMLDDSLMYPDDDFIWQVWNQQNKGHEISFYEAGDLVKYNQSMWEKSLQLLGNVAYKGDISTSAITRILEIDMKKMSTQMRMFFYGFVDVGVSMIAMSVRRPEFEQQIKWLFRDIKRYTDIFGSIEPKRQELINELSKTKDDWSKMIYERK